MLPVASAPPQAEAVTLFVPTDPEQLQLLPKVPEFAAFWFVAVPLHVLKFQVDAANVGIPKVTSAAPARTLLTLIQQIVFMAFALKFRLLCGSFRPVLPM